MHRILRVILLILAVAAFSPDGVSAPPKRKAQQSAPRTADKIKKEQINTQRRITETSDRLNTTGRELKRQLNNLNSLNADIRQQDATVRELRSRIDSIGNAINATTDSIAILERRLEDMRAAYAHALRQLQPSAGHMNAFAFIFSSDSFSEAYSRLRYLNRFSEWRQRKAADITAAIGNISQQRQHLTGLRHNQDMAYRQAEEARQKLTLKQGQSEEMVKNLRKQDSQLRAELSRQKKQAEALDRELDRIITAEQERIARQEAERKKNSSKTAPKNAPKNTSKSAPSTPASGSSADASDISASAIASARAETRTAAEVSEALSGTFAQNKGRLMFPVSGRYKIVRQFGRQPHPTQRHVMTDNSGIDIEVPTGSTARAVFDGTVSAIFRQDGFHTIIMLRHGKYLTVYAGLATSAVRQGQKVKAGQQLGTIYSDPADDNRTILHFEVRDERQKLNPTAWVR